MNSCLNRKSNLIRRKVEIVVLSDIHLGTYGCHAEELLNYLKSIEPKILVLNGDIIDMWQFRKRYFPMSHLKVVKCILDMMSRNVEIYYITGNHDETFRKFSGYSIGNLKIVNKLLLDLDGKKCWIFHGDVFDVTMKYSKWLTRLGSVGYDILIFINSFVNYILKKLGLGKISLSKKIKNSVKKAMDYIMDFRKTASDIAISNGYDYIICGHIHHPEITKYSNEKGSIIYMNPGDWIENLTALEYNNKQWTLYQYSDSEFLSKEINYIDIQMKKNKELFKNLVEEIILIQPN